MRAFLKSSRIIVLAAMALALVVPTLLLAAPYASARDITVPNYWDPNRRIAQPDLTGIRTIRFLTELDAPPFSYRAPDGGLTGFNVELARAVCRVLDVACTIQALRWDLLQTGIADGRGDAIIAALPITEETRRRFLFTNQFLEFPGRFVARAEDADEPVTPADLAGDTIAVVTGTAHEAFLADQFPDAETVGFSTLAEARDGLKSGAFDLLFADALTMSFWLNGLASEGCCAFRGGPFLESHYFGEGMAIAVDSSDTRLRQALDAALWDVQYDGTYLEIFLRSFPLGFY